MNKIKHWIERFPSWLREWVWLSKYMKRYWGGILFYILLGIVGVVMGLVIALAQKDLLNAVTATNKDLHLIISAICVVAGLAVGQILLNAGSSWVSAHINIKVINEIREDIFRKIVASRWESLAAYHSGDIINRLEGDVTNISSGVISFLPSLITRSVQFIGAFAIILYYDPTMAVFALLSAPVLVLSAKPLMKIMRKYNEKSRKINGEIIAFNEEVFQNVQLVKAFSLGKTYAENLRLLLKNYRRIQLDYTKISIVVGIVMGFIGLIAGYSCYGWGIYRLYTNAIDFGQMTLFLQLSSVLSGSFSGLVSLAPAAVSTATAAGRIMEVTMLPAETDADGEKAEALRTKAHEQGVILHADNLGFTYKNGDTPVMTHVSFTAESGQVVAFVGPSGGGKTTILRMMLGLLEPQEGQLTLESRDGELKVHVSESTRRLCAYVPQGNSIFSGTIESNLRVVAPDATEEDLIRALKAADAWGFVSALPETYHAPLGERGTNLSEGQLQRLSIARALLRHAPILIMDEATSALDPETEARVLRSLMEEDPYRLVLITTHRASMLDYADLVFKVDGEHCFEPQPSVKKTGLASDRPTFAPENPHPDDEPIG